MTDTRWVATLEPGVDKSWHARPEFYQATNQVHHLVCRHRHKSEKAAEDCAHRQVGLDTEDRVAL